MPTQSSHPPRTRIVILGGGFAGLYSTLHLQRAFRKRDDVELVLVSRNNYFTMTPLLFEAGSGVLEPRHAVSPLRPLFHLEKAQFVEAEILSIDLDRRVVHASLVPNGRLSLQSICYGTLRQGEINPFIAEMIFPESCLASSISFMSTSLISG